MRLENAADRDYQLAYGYATGGRRPGSRLRLTAAASRDQHRYCSLPANGEGDLNRCETVRRIALAGIAVAHAGTPQRIVESVTACDRAFVLGRCW